jgi:WD40 repeat protein
MASAWSQSAVGPHIDVGDLTIADYGPLAWSPDGTQLGVLATDTIRVYDLSGTIIASYSIDGVAYSRSLDWSDDGQRLVFEGPQGVAMLSLETGIQVPLFPGLEPDATG